VGSIGQLLECNREHAFMEKIKEIKHIVGARNSWKAWVLAFEALHAKDTVDVIFHPMDDLHSVATPFQIFSSLEKWYWQYWWSEYFLEGPFENIVRKRPILIENHQHQCRMYGESFAINWREWERKSHLKLPAFLPEWDDVMNFFLADFASELRRSAGEEKTVSFSDIFWRLLSLRPEGLQEHCRAFTSLMKERLSEQKKLFADSPELHLFIERIIFFKKMHWPLGKSELELAWALMAAPSFCWREDDFLFSLLEKTFLERGGKIGPSFHSPVELVGQLMKQKKLTEKWLVDWNAEWQSYALLTSGNGPERDWRFYQSYRLEFRGELASFNNRDRLYSAEDLVGTHTPLFWFERHPDPLLVESHFLVWVIFPVLPGQKGVFVQKSLEERVKKVFKRECSLLQLRSGRDLLGPFPVDLHLNPLKTLKGQGLWQKREIKLLQAPGVERHFGEQVRFYPGQDFGPYRHFVLN
jgi:hypothetical protein